MRLSPPYLWFVVALCATWFVLSVFTPERPAPPAGTEGRDYASYHYAGRAMLAGENPYDNGVLARLARDEGVRSRPPHPFIYPPPAAVLATATARQPLSDAVRLFRLLGNIGVLCGLLALAWRRPSEERVWLAGSLLIPGVAYGSHLAQANGWVFALSALAMVTVRRTPVVAGLLLGAAIQLKLTPLVFVLWWAARRRGRALLGVLVAAVGGLLLTAFHLEIWNDYLLRVLPSLLDGTYNGLQIRMEMFANHSVSSFVGAWTWARWPLLALTALGLLLWSPRAGALHGFAAWALWMLLFTPFTFDHHLLWVAPAWVVAGSAAMRGTISPIWAGLFAMAVAVLLVPTADYRAAAAAWPWLHGVLEEARHLALWALLALVVVTGRSGTVEAEPLHPPRG